MKLRRHERVISHIITQLKELRLDNNMSHNQLAKKSGVTRPAISHIESGKRKPSLMMSLKLAEALGKELSEIIREAENKEGKK